MTYILGMSAYYHDSAVVLIKYGIIISTAQEEWFTWIKHDKSFPLQSINFILTNNSTSLNQIDAVVFYEKPYLKFKRLLKTYINFSPMVKIFLSDLKNYWYFIQNLGLNVAGFFL